MNPIFRKRIAGAVAVLATSAGMLFGEAMIRPEKTAQADSWQYFLSNVGAYCEGCCWGGNNLCCSSSNRCRIDPT